MKLLMAGLVVLALACGGLGGDAADGAGSGGSAEAIDAPAAPGGQPGGAAPSGGQAARSAGAGAASGQRFPATAEGACKLQESCGCSTETYAACLPEMSVMPAEVHSCIVANDCPSFCGGGGLRCVESWYATMSEQSRQAHEHQMELIRNRPSGSFGPCAAGQTEIRDQYGSHVRCQ